MLDNIKLFKNRFTHLRGNNRGVTIIELIVVTAIAGLLIISTTTVMLFFYGDVLRGNLQSQLAVESQNVLRTIVEELRVSSGIRSSNTINDANAPGGLWTTSNTNLILIISTPVLNGSRQFVIDSATGSPYQNEIVYFANNGTLYKRYLANTSATGNTFKTSCPMALSSSSCPADVIMSKNFSTMNFVFYDQDDVQTSNIADARSIKLQIIMNRKTYGKDIKFDNSIRVTLRNTVL